MYRKKTKLRTVNLISIIFFIFASVFYLVHEKYLSLRPERSDQIVPVMTIHDGDTVSVFVERKSEKVRLIGIDAPEMGQEPWGEQAKQHLESLISSSDRKVRMELDLEKRDRYGRVLAYLWTIDGRMINLMMLRDGNAVLYTFPPNVRYSDEFRIAQKDARGKGKGIWSAKGLEQRPGDYRKKNPRI